MKIIRRTNLCAATFLLAGPMLRAQNYSNCRGFSLGASLTTVMKQTDQKLEEAVVRVRFEEMDWRENQNRVSSYAAVSL